MREGKGLEESAECDGKDAFGKNNNIPSHEFI